VVEQAVKQLQRSLTFWSNAYGGNRALKKLLRDVERLKQRAERELLQAV